jgi:hypothetical protein
MGFAASPEEAARDVFLVGLLVNICAVVTCSRGFGSGKDNSDD